MEETRKAVMVHVMTEECNHTELVYSVTASATEITGLAKCKHCQEVVNQVSIEKNIADLLDIEAANEVIEMLKE